MYRIGKVLLTIIFCYTSFPEHDVIIIVGTTIPAAVILLLLLIAVLAVIKCCYRCHATHAGNNAQSKGANAEFFHRSKTEPMPQETACAGNIYEVVGRGGCESELVSVCSYYVWLFVCYNMTVCQTDYI